MTPQQAIQQLQDLAKGSKEAMKRAEFTVNNNIALTAIALAPENTSKLVESIEILETDRGSSVIVGAPYSGYVEFGTGPFAADYVAELPESWKDEAMKFFVNGEGHSQAHPFFYPAVQQHIPELIPEVEKELEKLTK
ncbi:HK97-gp10 family putative phage morphogenesis protein [Mucilaginibacter xinganensis]|uniref:HK97 gp10 family phage protein n=1 Tax=Mucilaginibacter xinganensis TaxID=1234841 RepID=A0A223NXW7_9SPHI|nr:HK97-gp10 family putative phage morphogenesis protein [Mucilaginibacter xinganensis]ASU34411.1 hypothetical protein MuYL_2524 [Mucilaginibacter xinganensis]